MTCYHPITAWRVHGQNKLKFEVSSRDNVLEKLQVPCGRCVGCRLERSRQWAVRCVHEAQLHCHNCFITLTYNDENLPSPPTLVLEHFQLFMKRLRKRFGKDQNGNGIRFFHCGEYGEKKGRPHYHACLFNCDFPDKKLWTQQNGFNLYTSELLSELWGMGHAIIGDVTFESAAYVARYIMKKINVSERSNDETKQRFEDAYERFNIDTGEIITLKQEYITMSRRPGLASGWLEKFQTDVYPDDFVVINGRQCRPPRFYDERLRKALPLDYEEIMYKRHLEAQKFVDNNTPERLMVRETVQNARLKNLPRNLD